MRKQLGPCPTCKSELFEVTCDVCPTKLTSNNWLICLPDKIDEDTGDTDSFTFVACSEQCITKIIDSYNKRFKHVVDE